METRKPTMKVILIDPWGTANTADYLNGLIYGLNPLVDLTVFTNKYFLQKINMNCTIKKLFFKKSENMLIGPLRKLVRGTEYIFAYIYIIRFLKISKNCDIVHINWLLIYNFDIIFLRSIKKYTKKLVYTAHNVVPHRDSKKYIKKLKVVYGLFDRIILHGESIKNEFLSLYPEFFDKLYIQKHGCNLFPSTNFSMSEIEYKIRSKVENYNRIFICFGGIFYNKGFDRVISVWDQEYEDTLLIIAGKRIGKYLELDLLKHKINALSNILFLDYFVDENTLNYLINKSNLIILPYRHASMSGVIFTACDFKKTVLCTEVGALSEYLEPGIDSFLVPNSDEALKYAILDIHKNYSNERLNVMGSNLNSNIRAKCSWDVVASGLIENCYCK